MHVSCHLQNVYHRPLLEAWLGRQHFLSLAITTGFQLEPALCLETLEPSTMRIRPQRAWDGSWDTGRTTWDPHCPHSRAEVSEYPSCYSLWLEPMCQGSFLQFRAGHECWFGYDPAWSRSQIRGLLFWEYRLSGGGDSWENS